MARAIKSRSVKRSFDTTRLKAPVRTKNTNWTVSTANGLQLIRSRQLANLDWVTHGYSTRIGGKSKSSGPISLNLGFTDWDARVRVDENRERFVAALPARGMSLVALRQFHSDVIHVAVESKGQAPMADAVITNAAGLLLGVQTADCVPILLADTRQRVVAAIHAGWRGTVARIAAKTLGRMLMEFGTRPQDVVAAIGPAIGRCCYEVGSDVARLFAAQFQNAADWFEGPFEQLAYGEDPLWLPWLTMMPPGHVPPLPRAQLDLRASNRWQLIDAGVPENQIDVSDLCTSCRADLLFSYRREREKAGRMLSVIGIRSK